jgi:predicted phage tail protein
MPDSEAERLKRLREKQLQARDPLAGERKFQKNSSAKEKRMQKPFSLKEDWHNVPYVAKIPMFALIVGIIGTAILVRVWVTPYTIYIGAAATAGLIIFGAVLGNAIDLRENIKKTLK